MHENLGDRLVELAQHTRASALLVAPFVKAEALKRVTEMLNPDVQLTVTTRWNPEEIIAGVSDLDVWNTIQARSGAKLRLLPGLHAKYFRFDGISVLGSANLTSRALGWSPQANIELLVEMPESDFSAFEDLLLARSFEVDEGAYDAMRLAVEALTAHPAPNQAYLAEDSTIESASWFPRSLNVHRLFSCYLGQFDTVIESAQEDGRYDLAALNPPLGLDEQAFGLFVSARLQQVPAVAAVDAAASKAIDRTAGAQLLVATGDLADEEATNAWEVLSAWMGYFFPYRYRTKSTLTGPALERSQVIGLSRGARWSVQ